MKHSAKDPIVSEKIKNKKKNQMDADVGKGRLPVPGTIVASAGPHRRPFRRVLLPAGPSQNPQHKLTFTGCHNLTSMRWLQSGCLVRTASYPLEMWSSSDYICMKGSVGEP